MTSISPLNETSYLATTLSSRATQPSTSTTGTESQSALGDSPPSIVTIPSPANETTPLYTPQGTANDTLITLVQATTSTEMDGITSLMARDVLSNSLSGEFSNLGSALLDRFSSTGSDYSQSVSVLSGSAPGAPGAVGEGISSARGDVNLTVTTASGIQVDIALQSSNGSLGVSIKSSGQLDTAERDAIAKLAEGFQQAIDGLNSNPPTLDLSGLSQYDSSVLSSVNMQFNLGGVSGNFTSNSSYQSVSLTDAQGSMNLKVDKGQSALLGTGSQRAQAIAAYLNEFNAANAKGHGNTGMMTLFDAAFTQLNGGDTTSQQSSDSSSASGLTSISADASWLMQSEQSMLTGLNDFTGSITETTLSTVSSTPGTFSYQVSQSTTVQGNAQNGSISQTQQSQLKATYSQTGSSPDSTDDVTINDSANSTVRIATQDGQIVKASLNQSSSDSTTNAEYSDGKLVSDITTPTTSTTSKDLLALLQPLLTNGDATSDNSTWQQALSGIRALILPNANSI